MLANLRHLGCARDTIDFDLYFTTGALIEEKIENCIGNEERMVFGNWRRESVSAAEACLAKETSKYTVKRK
jgi:hypothetical protein